MHTKNLSYTFLKFFYLIIPTPLEKIIQYLFHNVKVFSNTMFLQRILMYTKLQEIPCHAQ